VKFVSAFVLVWDSFLGEACQGEFVKAGKSHVQSSLKQAVTVHPCRQIIALRLLRAGCNACQAHFESPALVVA
jgi:hypothetical protein